MPQAPCNWLTCSQDILLIKKNVGNMGKILSNMGVSWVLSEIMVQFGALTSRNDCLGPQSDFKVFKVFKVLGLAYTLKTKIGNLRGIEQI